MSSKPWFPLYVNDYLADTTAMEAAEHGSYLLLIMAYWKQGGPLRDDDNTLRKLARAGRDEWADIRKTLEQFFTVKDGFWVHKRLEREIKEAEAKYERRARAGAKGGKQKGNSNASSSLKQNGSNAAHNLQLTSSSIKEEIEPKGSLPEPTAKQRKRNSYPDDFEQFWKAYPTTPNMPKAEAFKQWKKLDPDDKAKAIVAIGPFRAWIAKQRDYTVLYAERFLSQRRFDGYAEQARPQLVHPAPEQVLVALHDDPDLFDFCVEFHQQRNPNFDPSGKEHLKVPAPLLETYKQMKARAS